MTLRVGESILDLIGQTPLLRLKELEPEDGAEVWAKLEYLNPGGSVKDRAALGLIREGERNGLLVPGGVIIEPTAGNTGIGLALIGRRKNYRVILVVPAQFSREKMILMQALGGELVITPEELGMKGAIERAYELAASIPNAWVPQQFENPANPAYHYEVTGAECWEQTGGRVDAIVMGGGTGGTFSGIVRAFRDRGCPARGVLVEPQGSIWGGGAVGPHQVEGIGNSFWPGTLHKDLIDEIITVRDGPALDTALALARHCGVLAGGSGGAAVNAALQVAARLRRDQRVLTLVPDAGERYMSKGMYAEIR